MILAGLGQRGTSPLAGYGAGVLAGPHAGAAAFTPEDLTSLVDWWDPDAAYCQTDGAVSLNGTTQYLKRVTPTIPSLGAMTIRMSVKPTNTTAIQRISSRWGGSQNQHIWWIETSGQLKCYIASSLTDGGSNYAVSTDTALTTGTSNEVVLVFDGSGATNADRLKMYVNGVQSTLTYTGTIPSTLTSSTADLSIGASEGGATHHFGGTLQCLGYSASALTGSALTAAHTATFYGDMSATRQADWFSFFNLPESSGTRADSAGSNDLTAVNAPGVAQGVASGPVQTGAPVKSWTGRTNSTVLSQATLASQPLWIASGQNSKPALRFDGVDDHLKTPVHATQAQPISIFAMLSPDNTAVARFWDTDVAGTNREGFGLDGTGKWFMYAGSGLTGGTAASGAHVVSAIYNGASSKARVNATEIIAADAGSLDYRGITVGRLATGNLPFDGDMGDLFPNLALATDAEIASAESFLNSKYAVY